MWLIPPRKRYALPTSQVEKLLQKEQLVGIFFLLKGITISGIKTSKRKALSLVVFPGFALISLSTSGIT